MNWADYKQSVNSGNSSKDNPEPSQRNTREGVETGHGPTLKTCSDCGQDKPLKEFYKKDRKHSNRRDGKCKACRIIWQREKKLGVTNADYWRMYHEQGGRCGICRRRLYSKRYKAFTVDRNHSTGEIRGLLCHNCNAAIGLLYDDPVALKRAAAWVEGTVRYS